MCLLDTDEGNISYQSSEIGKFWKKNTHALSSFSYAGLPWLQKSRARQEGPPREFWWQPTKEYSLEDRWLPEDPVLHTKMQNAIATNLYDSNHVEGIRAETWITLRGFRSEKFIWLESRWRDSSRDLNHVEGIQVGEIYMTRITLKGFEPRLESHWRDSGRRNLYDSNHVEGIRTETWITLRGFRSEKFIWLESRWGDSKTTASSCTIWAQKGLGTSWATISLGPQ
jgi:hypothetical protein